MVHYPPEGLRLGPPAVKGRRGRSFGDLPADKEARCAWVIAAGPRGVAKQLKA